MKARLFLVVFIYFSLGAKADAQRVTLTSSDLSAWRSPTGQWQVVGDAFTDPANEKMLSTKPGTGVIFNGPQGKTSNLLSKAEFGDVKAHIEFMVSKDSNSGVYFMGRYEIQVFDSWKKESEYPGIECGGIYQRWDESRSPKGFEGHSPRVNASKSPGQWQTFDVIFRAPRFDAAGRKVSNARFEKVIHNGIVVHEDVVLTGPTRASTYNDEKPTGPLMLQGDHGPVAYRNIRIEPAGPLPFFAMDTATKDASHQTAKEQVEMVKELGYAGMRCTAGKGLKEMAEELDKNDLRLFTVYLGINIDPDQPKYGPELKEAIEVLRGRNAMLWLFVQSKRYKPSSPAGDDRAVEILREIADMAAEADVRVALYPHTGLWVQRVQDAVRVAKKVNRSNVGVTFNLCHWLMVDGGKNAKSLIQQAMPHLFVVTINGADSGGKDWKTLIQTLDRDTFDIQGFLKTLYSCGYTGPIGFQGYGIGGDAYDNLKRTMNAWRKLNDMEGSSGRQRPADNISNGPANVRFTIYDAGTEQTVPCRIHLIDNKGKPVLPEHLPSFYDHFCCDGTATLNLPAGKYRYVVEKGPEYNRCKGSFEINNGGLTEVTQKIHRIADMASEGFWSGELHVHRPVKDMKLLMQAEDIHVAPVLTWWNRSNIWNGSNLPDNRIIKFDGQCFCDLLGGEDERRGGAFMYFNMQRPIDITKAEPEYPCPLHFIEQAKVQPNVWIDIEKPFWWDVPVALAYGYGDSIGLLNNHCQRSEMMDNEAWGKPRPKDDFPSPLGNGFWSQYIYYQILNSGIRIAPSAGSASGVLHNPVGYNRVYVYTGSDHLDYDQWWENLRKGKCFVTNGPLIVADVSGQKPGHVFTADEGESVWLHVGLSLFKSNDPIDRIEIIKNGSVERAIPYTELRDNKELGTILFSRSGWFLIRVIADMPNTFRFASTAPYYVEIGSNKRYLSRKSIRFFIDWIEERIKRIDIEDSEKLKEVLKYHQKARRYWLDKLRLANAG
jgi:sugar phosphate isomerase/epimerase